MEKIGSFINYFLELISNVLKAVKVFADGEAMLTDIGAAVEDFGGKVEGLKD